MTHLNYPSESVHHRNVSTASNEPDVADITRTNVGDPSMARLQPSSWPTPRSAQTSAYQAVPQSLHLPLKTITSNEVELTSHHESPSHQRRSFNASEFATTAYGALRRSIWLRKWFWIETWSDVKKAPYARFGRRFLSHFLPLLVIIGLLSLLALMSGSPQKFTNDSSGNFCKPDGTFVLSFNAYTPWRRDSIFAINLNFGSYSFGVAKLIDVCWDVGVGRGGQALLAMFSYKVFTKGLSHAMELSSVTHDTFKAVTLQNDTISGMTILIKDFFKNGSRRTKVAISWTILAGLFVLAVPTWLSAMTGYTADITAYVRDTNGTLIPAANFNPVIYTIHDGERIGPGFHNDTQIVVPWGSSGSQLKDDNMYGCTSFDADRTYETQDIVFYSWVDSRCKWLWAVSRYVSDYGFLGKSNALNTTFHRPDESNATTPVLISRSLNISAHFALLSTTEYSRYYEYDWFPIPYGQTWQNPEDGQYTFNVSKPIFWDSISQTIFNLTEFNTAGSCQQEGVVKYKWGFSFLLLYVFVLTFLLWTIGMWIFYLDSWLHSRLDVEHSQMGVERAVLDLSESMLTRLDTDQVQLRNNSQLQPLVKPNMLTYSALSLKPSAVTRWTKFRWWRRDFVLKQWAKDEIWWLSAMFFFSLMLLLSWTTDLWYSWDPYVALLPVFGIILILAAGRETRSRWVLFAICLLVFLLLSCIWHSTGISPYWEW